jgi:sigma-B regulation protein RsbU (phosphoserine phosphatase)
MARYALVIGIAKYNSPSLHDLSKTATDAEAIAQILERHGNYRVILINQEVTGLQLAHQLEQFLLEQASHNEALIYFTGHGIKGITGADYLEQSKVYLAASDCKVIKANSQWTIREGGVSLSSLNKLIQKSILGNLIVILDACHSGEFVEKDLNNAFNSFNSRKDYFLITACRRAEKALAKKSDNHSVFSGALLAGLKIEQAWENGQITAGRLFDFIYFQLKNSPQEPIYLGGGRSIALVTYQQPQKTEVLIDETCPYQGLRYFTEEQAKFFFGRKKIVETLKQKLEQLAFVPVIGASGSGKSSIVRSGLIPWLKDEGWQILDVILPGDEPLSELKRVFTQLVPRTEVNKISSLIETSGLFSVIEYISGSDRLLLVIDQFEEVFSFCSNYEDRARFIQLLAEVSEILNSRLAIVITMRVDFLENCLQCLEKDSNQERKADKTQDLLSSLGFALRSFSNLKQFLELTPLMAARVTDSIGGVIILIKNSKLHIEQIHSDNIQIGSRIRSVFERVIHQINISINTEIKNIHRLSLQDLLEQKVKQELDSKIHIFGTPILVGNIEQGRLFVFSTEPNYIWTSSRRKLSQLVADQTAVAIGNSELIAELRSKERQDRELEIASEIQLRLLPSKDPQIQGLELSAKCQMASRVGGNYYNFIPTNGKDVSQIPWSIVIGDVMGKGVPAGLIMTMTMGMLRAEVLNRRSPEQMIQHINRLMCANLENWQHSLSMFYSEYNPKKRKLSFCNAGHNPPLWWQASTNTLKKLDTVGMRIGIDMNSEYEEITVEIYPGDIIAYYTSGLTNAVNASGDHFEEDNLRRAFQWACLHLETTQEILDYLFDEVAKFVGLAANSTNDMTLIVIKVKQ